MVSSEQQNISDFWWLTSEEAVKYKYIYFCHQEPYSDEPNSKKDPKSVSRFLSVDEEGNLSSSTKYYPLNFINFWRKRCANINIFRSFGLSSSECDDEKLFGPFLIDIDREEREVDKGYMQNLDEALEDTRRIVSEYLYGFKKEDFRIFFTGHKGFNVEVCPQALDVVHINGRLQQFKRILKDINRLFISGKDRQFVDKIHCEVRLHNSINRWIANDGKIKNRMKFELSLHELNNVTAEEVCRKSEKLALNYLSTKRAV